MRWYVYDFVMYIILHGPVCRSFIHFSHRDVIFIYHMNFHVFYHANKIVFYGFWPLVGKWLVLMYDYSWYLWYVYNIGIIFVHTKTNWYVCDNVMYIITRIKENLGFFHDAGWPLQWFFLPTPPGCLCFMNVWMNYK